MKHYTIGKEAAAAARAARNWYIWGHMPQGGMQSGITFQAAYLRLRACLQRRKGQGYENLYRTMRCTQ